MKRTISMVALPFALWACGGGDDGGGDGAATGGSTSSGGSGATGGGGTSGTGATGGTSGSSGTGGGQCPTGVITAAPANNYTFASDISLKPVGVQPNSELVFDWSELTTDFNGHTISPMADIDSVLLVVVGLTIEELEMHINADDPLTPFNRGALELLTNNTLTTSSLYDFSVPGQPGTNYRNSPQVQETVDAYMDPTVTDPASNVIVVTPSTGALLGEGARMVQVLQLDTGSTTTMIDIGGSMKLAPGTDGHTGGTDGASMSLTYDVDLQALVPTPVPAGRADLTVDWMAMTTNGLGRMWLPRSIDQIIVANYTQSLEELENQFLDLELIAERLYRAEVPSDEPFSLSELRDEQSQPFAGIDGNGVWVLALSCQFVCGNPAPWYLTILTPCN